MHTRFTKITDLLQVSTKYSRKIKKGYVNLKILYKTDYA